MFPRFPKSIPILLTACALLASGGCSRRPPAAKEEAGPAADYSAPPQAVSVVGGVIQGQAQPNARVRLASPDGSALVATADRSGHWRLQLPPSTDARILSFSEVAGARQAQGEGYLVIDPSGKAALLRAGAGAIRLDPRRAPALSALDYDAEGGAVISGTGPPQSLVFLKVDGRQLAEARVDAAGRYAIALNQPLLGGPHSLEVSGDNFVSAARTEASPPAPLVGGPMRRQLVTGGLRVDWLTPGGGVQSTVLVD